MHINVTHTKIIVPRRRPDLLARERLLGMLEDLLDYRLTLIAAPAGYGKTSLLVDLAQQVEYPTCWYALDPLDRDPQRFLAHFIASIRHVFPDFGEKASAVLKGVKDSELDFDHLVSTIVNEIYDTVSEHFVIVLDDYHLIEDSEEVNRFINRFGQEMDENCHLVIASRTLLTLPDLPLLVGRSQVKGLSFEELAFRPDEIRALLQQNYRQSVSEEQATQLAEETEGWITGLLLSAETMWRGMSDRVRVAKVSGVDLYEYLAQQVLNQQPAHIQEFLLRTSLVEEFDANLCQEVFGNAPEGLSWLTLIASVMQNNLFVQQVENGGTWLRYHHLFQEFLQDRILRKSPDEAMQILRRLVEVFSGRAEWERAYAICQRLDDETLTAPLIEQASSSLARSGRMKLLATWIDKLSNRTFNHNPALIAYRGVAATMLGEVESGLFFLDKAEALLKKDDNENLLASTILWQASAHRFLGSYQRSIEIVDKALQLIGESERLQTNRAEALRMRGMGLHSLGRSDEAIEPLTQSLKIYKALGDDVNIPFIHIDLGLVYVSVGKYGIAQSHYHQALETWRTTNNLTQLANLLNNLGVLAHIQGETLQADSFLVEALEYAKQSGFARIEAFSLASLGDIYLELDLIDAAETLYLQSREIAKRIDDRFLIFYLGLMDVRIALSRKNLDRASTLLHSMKELLSTSQSTYYSGLWELENSHLALMKTDIPTAIKSLGAAIRSFTIGGQRTEIAQAHIYLALAHYVQGNTNTAIEYISEISIIATNLESLYPLISVGRVAIEMLEAIKDASQTGVFVNRLLKEI